MKHAITIGVGTGAGDGIICCQQLDLRERLMRWLLGKKQRLTILVPGDSVRTLTIVKEGEGDEPDERT